MSTPFLKATTSLCLALSLVQPVPSIAWAQSAAADCVPGTEGCPIVLPKKPGDKAPARVPQSRPQTAPQRTTPAAPKLREQSQPPVQNKVQPRVVQPPKTEQNRSREQVQQPTPTPPVVKPRVTTPAAPKIRQQTQPSAPSKAQPRVVQPPKTEQNRTREQVQQPAPTPPVLKPKVTTPTAPRVREQTHQPVQNRAQPRVVQPQATLPPTTVAPTVQPRTVPALPLAAQVPPDSFTASAPTTAIRIAPTDVRPSRDNRFLPRPRDGLSDLEKFGLIILGAAIVGAILSDGQTVVLNSGDRVVARDHRGRYHVYHDDNVLLRRPGSVYTTRRFPDGSLLTRILYPSGITIFTISSYDGYVLRRWVQYPHRPTVILYDDTQVLPAPVVSQLPQRSPVHVTYTDRTSADLLRAALMARPLQPIGRAFNLNQIRNIPEVRYLVPEIEIASVNFASGSAAVSPDQASTLSVLARVMTDMIAQNPAEVFLVEGHSDAVGDPAMNLALSDARAEATAAALTEYFGVPPQNMVTQGYGEADPREPTLGPSEVNRHVILRRITELLPQSPN